MAVSKQADVALGEVLRELRRLKNLSQEDAAHAVGIHRAQYGRYEQGNNAPTFLAMAKIAKGLGASLDDIAEAVERKTKSG